MYKMWCKSIKLMSVFNMVIYDNDSKNKHNNAVIWKSGEINWVRDYILKGLRKQLDKNFP